MIEMSLTPAVIATTILLFNKNEDEEEEYFYCALVEKVFLMNYDL